MLSARPPVTTNKQGENIYTILTSERLNHLYALEERLKDSTINDAVYFDLDKNDAEGDPEIDLKVDTHTSDRNNRKVMETTTRKLPQNLLSNQPFPTITEIIDPRIPHGVATCEGTPHDLLTPTSKVVITDTVCSSARILRNPEDVIRTGRDGTIPRDCTNSISSLRLNSPVLIGGGTTVSPNRTGTKDIVCPKGPQ